MSEKKEGERVLEGELVQGPSVRGPGRPTKFDEVIVGKLETAFHSAFNITEACQYAGIDRSTYYDWLGQDDVFSYRMSVAQAGPNKAAKAVLMEAIYRNDPNLALRFLMLRDPDFKPKLQHESDPTVIETRNNLKEALNAIAKHDPSSQPTPPAEQDDRGVVEDSPTDIS